MTAHPCHFGLSLESEKSTLSYWALAKYLHFEFSVWQGRAKAEPPPFHYIKEKATRQRLKKWAKSQKATYHKPKSKKTQKTYALLKFLKIHHKFQKFSKFSVSLLKQRVKVKPLPFYSKKRQAKRQVIKSEQSRATQKMGVMSHKKPSKKRKIHKFRIQ